jgi:hypothetical protein
MLSRFRAIKRFLTMTAINTESKAAPVAISSEPKNVSDLIKSSADYVDHQKRYACCDRKAHAKVLG